MNALDTIYNHYLTAYAPRSINSPYDTHKKSELRGIYNSIVKMNKEAPLAILNTSVETQQFAVGMKESARSLHNTIASLSGPGDDTLLNKKTAFSSDESIATAKYIGDTADVDHAPTFTIEVDTLASVQENKGRYLPSDAPSMAADNYSFDIGINNLNYEFQFSINEGDTNRNVQERLARLVNNSGIGLEARIDEDEEGNSALVLSSKATGISEGKDSLFTVSDDNTSKASGSVSYFGIGDITTPASNAQFRINGMERSAFANNFTIEKTYEINLTGVSSAEGATTEIGLKTDHESVKENLSELIGGFNNFLKAASEYNEVQLKNKRLIGEMSSIASLYTEQLGSLGIHASEDGTLSINDDELSTAINTEDLDDLFSPLKGFTNALLRKSDSVSLNPMNYVDKTVVAYKNPGHGYASPYVTSAYSGMMFNSYC